MTHRSTAQHPLPCLYRDSVLLPLRQPHTRPRSHDTDRHRGRAAHGIPHLTAGFVTPTVRVAARRQRTGMGISDRNDDELAATHHRYGRGRLDDRTVAQLTDVVPAPTVRRAVRSETAGVLDAGAHRDEFEGPADRRRNVAVGLGTVPQLAVAVPPPTRAGTVHAHGAGERPSGRDRPQRPPPGDGDGCGAGAIGAVAELPG